MIAVVIDVGLFAIILVMVISAGHVIHSSNLHFRYSSLLRIIVKPLSQNCQHS